MPDLLTTTPPGLFCEAGNFYIDPWKPVDRAMITHAHADHARTGCQRYLAASSGREVMQIQLCSQFSPDISCEHSGGVSRSLRL